jgi:thioredoxin 2
VVREVAAELAGKVVVAQVNTQENSQVAARFGIRGIPALFLLQGGKVLDQLAGAQPKPALLAMVARHVRP